MNINQALKKYNKIEIELLLSHVLKKPKEFVFLHPETKLCKVHYTSVMNLIKRRQKGEPMAYILGYKDFYGLRFKVNRSVLIPRPETEMVVDLVIVRLRSLFSWRGEDVASASERQMRSKLKDSPHLRLFPSRGRGRYGLPIKILDLGTGCGNIIISLAKALSPSLSPSPQGRRKIKYELYASDISAKALKVAEKNAKKFPHHHTLLYDGKIKFIKSNLLENIKGKFDIIIANLPYGWQGWKNRFSAVKGGLKFEPQTALFAREKGLILIRQLMEQIAKRKNQPRIIYIEFDPRQKSDLQKLIKKYLPKRQIQFYKDYNNFWRYAEIKSL